MINGHSISNFDQFVFRFLGTAEGFGVIGVRVWGNWGQSGFFSGIGPAQINLL